MGVGILTLFNYSVNALMQRPGTILTAVFKQLKPMEFGLLFAMAAHLRAKVTRASPISHSISTSLVTAR